VVRSPGRDGLEHRADFIAFQVIDCAGWSALDGYRQEPLGFFDLFGIARCQKAREGVNSGKAGITCGNAVLPLRFEMIQKNKDVFSPKMLKLKVDNPTAVAHREKPQEQHECIAIAQHGPRTQSSRERQMLGKEPAQSRREFRR
jgi:hypothetical protein